MRKNSVRCTPAQIPTPDKPRPLMMHVVVRLLKNHIIMLSRVPAVGVHFRVVGIHFTSVLSSSPFCTLLKLSPSALECALMTDQLGS
jgi:hypothetical protein